MSSLNRKRQRLDPIGASEFCLLVQSNDTVTVRKALLRFVSTTHSDAILAKPKSDTRTEKEVEQMEDAIQWEDPFDETTIDNESSDHGEEKDSVSEPIKKRYKKDEDWKQDSASYNVPFVGTSVPVAVADPVRINEWPTGLLKAYLGKSPLAVELTGDTLERNFMNKIVDKSQQESRHNNIAVAKVYLQALTALLSAARDCPDDSEPRFVAEIISHRIPSLMELLQSECKGTKIGALVAGILQVLNQLSQVSTRTARHVARILELQDSVFRAVWKTNKDNKYSETDAAATIAAVQLTTTLTRRSNDSVVRSCICAAPIKERKIRPGLLYIALQRSFPSNSDSQSDAYLLAFHCFLRTLRSKLDDTTTSKSTIFRDLFGRECLQHLSHWATTEAPTLDANSVEDVLMATDKYQDITMIRTDATMEEKTQVGKYQIGIEARRCLFILLGDFDRSPLLYSILSTTNSRHLDKSMVEQHLTRSFVHLLEDGTIPYRQFVLGTLRRVPVLFPTVLRMLPPPTDYIQHPWAAMVRLNCFIVLLSEGPLVVDCLVGRDESNIESDDTETITILIFPLKKQLFLKMLLGPNQLVAWQAIKFYLVAVERCRKYLDSLEKARYMAEMISTNILPDWSIVSGIFAKLKFASSNCDRILWGHTCNAIQALGTVLSTYLDSTIMSMDWTKLLPKDTKDFCRAPLFVQTMILSALDSVVTMQQVS